MYTLRRLPNYLRVACQTSRRKSSNCTPVAGGRITGTTYSRLKSDEKNTFDEIAYGSVSEERPASRTVASQYTSLAKLESTVRERVESVPALVKKAVVRLFGVEGRTKE